MKHTSIIKGQMLQYVITRTERNSAMQWQEFEKLNHLSSLHTSTGVIVFVNVVENQYKSDDWPDNRIDVELFGYVGICVSP